MFDAQSLFVAAIVLGAAAYLVRRAYLFVFGNTAGGCGNCPSSGGCSSTKQVVQIKLNSPEK